MAATKKSGVSPKVLSPKMPAPLRGGLSKEHTDSWYNALVGLGKSMDKSNKTFFGDFDFMDRNQLSRMYVGDGIGRRIVDIVADDMTREWIEITMEDESQKDILEGTLKKLKAEVYFNEALKWERLFGGAVIVLGAMDGNALDVPLDMNRCKSVERCALRDAGRSEFRLCQLQSGTIC